MTDSIETGVFSSLTAAPAEARQLHIVSWNIARGSQFDAVSEFLADADADLILLQECDRHNRRTEYRNVAKELAQTLGMHYVFGIEFEELGQGSRTGPAHHGQATLSRWPLLEARVLQFRTQSKFWAPRWWIPSLSPLQRRAGSRMALITRVMIGRHNLVVYNVHLESRGGDGLRLVQLGELLDDARQYSSDVQLLIAGDFNFDLAVDPQQQKLISAGLQNPFDSLGLSTISDRSSNRPAIDWILIRGAKEQRPRVHHFVRGSDHYPLSLMLELP